MKARFEPSRFRLRLSPAMAVLLLIAFVFEGLALAAFSGVPLLASRAGLQGALFHAVGILAAIPVFFAVFPPAYRGSQATACALFAGFCLAMPLLGLLGLAAFRALLSIQPEVQTEPVWIVGESLALTDPMPFLPHSRPSRPILEILQHESSAERCRAVLALRFVQPKQALPVLQKAIQDSDEYVRILAQAQFNKIISWLELGIKRMEAEAARRPSDTRVRGRLAELYHELVYLGLASEESEVLYIRRAIELLEQVLALEPENHGVRFDLLKLLIKKRDIPGARQSLKTLREHGFPPEFLFPWEADLVFQERNWPELRSCLVALRDCRAPDANIREVIAFWLSVESPSPSHA